ncbi:MAG: Y-family DNA polymerase [Alphaproteobacteria bacterium]
MQSPAGHRPVQRGVNGPPLPSDASGQALGDAPNAAPLVLSTASQSGAQITATNPAADRHGLYAGMALADARAIFPALLVAPGDPEGDSAALHRLALWCQGYSPLTRPDGPDGLAIDITGCAHLFGGETGLLAHLAARLHNFGLTAKLAVAPTIGGAWAMARHGAGMHTITTPKNLRQHLAPLPVAALRLEEPVIASLAKVGLKQICDLIGKPSAPLAARFGPHLMARLGQALGKQSEIFCPMARAPFYRAQARFADPITTLPAIEAATRHLARDLAQTLTKAGRGARTLALALYRVDGWSERLDVQTSALGLSRDGDHLARLLCERLDKIQDHAGYGFEALTLSAFDVETATPHQEFLQSDARRVEKAGDLARLLDRLINRFGAGNVARFTPHASYIPERAVRAVPALRKAARHNWAAHARAMQGAPCLGRPFLLLPRPEPVTTLSEVPDGPPTRFEWRRISHRVTRADGPERIAPEWWCQSDTEHQIDAERQITAKHRQTRDYYRIEDDTGRRFWLYRDGLHDRKGDIPRWFIHGVFV